MYSGAFSRAATTTGRQLSRRMVNNTMRYSAIAVSLSHKQPTSTVLPGGLTAMIGETLPASVAQLLGEMEECEEANMSITGLCSSLVADWGLNKFYCIGARKCWVQLD
jgi:hypothetical protein